MEEVLASHPDVAECAVLGIKDAMKGEVPCGFVVLKAGRRAARRPRSRRRSSRWCASKHRPGRGVQAGDHRRARLPKTRSGKILRGTMKKIADGDSWTMPATIEDPKALDEIGAALLKGRV